MPRNHGIRSPQQSMTYISRVDGASRIRNEAVSRVSSSLNMPQDYGQDMIGIWGQLMQSIKLAMRVVKLYENGAGVP